MQRLLAFLLVMLLAFSVACGDDGDNDDDDAAEGPAATLTTDAGTGGDATATTATGGDMTATTGDDDGGDGDAAEGETIAQTQCVACHSIDGSVIVGPSWQGLFGSEVELEGGETVMADEAYIRESIETPDAKLHAGFANLMPDLNLDDDQIADLIAYIKTLE